MRANKQISPTTTTSHSSKPATIPPQIERVKAERSCDSWSGRRTRYLTGQSPYFLTQQSHFLQRPFVAVDEAVQCVYVWLPIVSLDRSTDWTRHRPPQSPLPSFLNLPSGPRRFLFLRPFDSLRHFQNSRQRQPITVRRQEALASAGAATQTARSHRVW